MFCFKMWLCILNSLGFPCTPPHTQRLWHRLMSKLSHKCWWSKWSSQCPRINRMPGLSGNWSYTFSSGLPYLEVYNCFQPCCLPPVHTHPTKFSFVLIRDKQDRWSLLQCLKKKSTFHVLSIKGSQVLIHIIIKRHAGINNQIHM